jgi:hypothetical protein
MSAIAVIKQVEKAGIRLVLNGDNLRLKGAAEPPPKLLARIREHKLSIVAILEQKAAGIEQNHLAKEPSKPSKPPAPSGKSPPDAALSALAEMERETYRPAIACCGNGRSIRAVVRAPAGRACISAYALVAAAAP